MPLSGEKPNQKFERHFRKPLFAAVTTVVGVIAGFLGSVYTDDLKASFPFHFTVVAPETFWLFWGLLALFGAMFGAIQWAQSRANEKSQADLTETTSDIQRTVKELLSLPPQGFLDDFKDYLVNAEYVAERALRDSNLTKSDAAGTIRTVLDMIVSLAFLFHKERGETSSRFAGNIMVYKPVGALSSEREAVKSRLRFWEKHLDLNAYLGVLDLRKELSTTTDTNEPVPDGSLQPFAYAVPNLHGATRLEDLRRRDLLPGAPFTFITKQVQLFVTATDLLNAAKAFNFTPQAIRMIEDYFKSTEGKNVQSFISIPIPSPSLDPAADPIGILNIHRDKDGLFKERGVELFPPLALPFCVILSRLLARYETLPEPIAPAPPIPAGP